MLIMRRLFWAMTFVLVQVIAWLCLHALTVQKSMHPMQIVILTRYMGASERIVAYDLSDPLVRSLAKVKQVNSISVHNAQGISKVVLGLTRESDPVNVAEHIQIVLDHVEGQLPEGISNPKWMIVPRTHALPLWT